METLNCDLAYIAKHLNEWPTAATAVRLDFDGEICFEGNTTQHDFYPDAPGADWRLRIIATTLNGYKHPCFLPRSKEYPASGRYYTQNEWAQARKELLS